MSIVPSVEAGPDFSSAEKEQIDEEMLEEINQCRNAVILDARPPSKYLQTSFMHQPE
jgi:hypothetical protein